MEIIYQGALVDNFILTDEVVTRSPQRDSPPCKPSWPVVLCTAETHDVVTVTQRN